MTILFVDRNAKIGGRNSYLRNLVPALRALGHRCYLLCGGGPAMEVTRQAFDGVAWHPPFGPWAHRAVGEAIRRWGVDVVATQTTTCARHAVAAARAAGVPLFMHIHSRTAMEDAGSACEYAAGIVVMNQGTADHIVGHYPDLAGRLHVTPLPLDPVRFAPLPPRPGSGFHVLYLARLSRTKGKPAFAATEAASALADVVPGLALTIVGGRGARLRKATIAARRVNARHGRDVVRVLGQTLDPIRYMAEADVVVGAGYVALEALSLNRRTVGLGVAGVFGEVTAECLDAALAANFGDTGARYGEATAETVYNVLKDCYEHHVRHGQISWAHSRIAEISDPSRIARQLVTIYSSGA